PLLPATRTWLVKLPSRLASVSTGRSSSRPTSDQVPDDTYAAPGSVMGTPTTPEAVSCAPTAITSNAAVAPTSAATSSRRAPIRVPGSTKNGNSDRGRLSLSIKVAFQVPVPTSSIPVVEALVRSTTCSPVSQNPSKSGSISILVVSSITPAS